MPFLWISRFCSNQAIVSTGRLSSNKPNFQNIPIKTDVGKEIRKAFIPQNNNYYIYSFDYTNKKILWAKNFKIPFRSNLKIFENKLIVSNQISPISIFLNSAPSTTFFKHRRNDLGGEKGTREALASKS